MKTTLHIPDDLHRRLKHAATEESTSVTALVLRNLLAAYPAPKKGTKA